MFLFISVSHLHEFIYVFEKNKIIFFQENLCFQKTASFLVEIIQKMKKKNILNSINKIFLSSGPGSFTSLRIADIFAQSICFSKDNIKYLKINIFEQIFQYMSKKKITDHIILVPTDRNLYSLKVFNNVLVDNVEINIYQDSGKYIIYESHFKKYKNILKNYCDFSKVDFLKIKNEDCFIYDLFYDKYDFYKNHDILYFA